MTSSQLPPSNCVGHHAEGAVRNTVSCGSRGTVMNDKEHVTDHPKVQPRDPSTSSGPYYPSPSPSLSFLSSTPLRAHDLSSRPSAHDHQAGASIGESFRPGEPANRVRPSSPLRISTDLPSQSSYFTSLSLSPPKEAVASLSRKISSGSLTIATRTPSLRAALANSIGTSSYGPASAASSVVASPIISALGEVTPLPSPIMSGDSPGPWKRVIGGGPASPPAPARPRFRSMAEDTAPEGAPSSLGTIPGEGGSSRKGYGGLQETATASSALAAEHARDRSASEYVPEASHVPKRHVTVSGSHAHVDSDDAQAIHIRREQNYAQAKGLTPMAPTHSVPTPPPSDSSQFSNETRSDHGNGREGLETFEAIGRYDKKKRRWRAVRDLGQGTFSRVILATSQPASGNLGQDSGSLDRKSLVAVKLCEHGPKGGASEERVEMSLKRELEIMRSIHHHSLVDLKAWSIEPTRALLVLGYCPGGDLFDVATQHKHLLTAPLLRRIFAELVGALQCLHEKMIVHRDIKLENVLVNLEPPELANTEIDWTTYPYPVVTLTDLGLSRRITDGEKLETRCGSEDYAAPEVILGQKYDGRGTDAWSLGVLLYALLEARLPFDPPPGTSDMHRMRSRTSHRIARIDWVWVEYAGEDGDHDGNEDKFRDNDLLGAMQITEGLLRRERSRWSIDRVSQHPWVQNAFRVDGGLRFREEEEGEEIK